MDENSKNDPNIESNDPKKESFFSRARSSINSSVAKTDSFISPKVGKSLYMLFKWLTILIFIVGIPLFVLIYEITITQDSYTFETNLVTYSPQGDPDFISVQETFTYSQIDTSLDDIYTDGDIDLEDNIFLTTETVYDSDGIERQASLFYGVLVQSIIKKNDTSEPEIPGGCQFQEGVYYKYDESGDGVTQDCNTVYTKEELSAFQFDPTTDANLVLRMSDYLTVNGQTLTSRSKDTISYFLYNNSMSYHIDDPDDQALVETPEEAQTGFREVFPPQAQTENGDSTQSTGTITGWVLVVIGVLTGILTIWFSKWSKVSFETPYTRWVDSRKLKKQEKKTNKQTQREAKKAEASGKEA